MDVNYYKGLEPFWGVWKIKRLLGEGSFGKVFEIEREDFGMRYTAALKAISIPQSESEIMSLMASGVDAKGTADYYRGFAEEVVKEFALMAKLKGNSNIVSYEDHMVIEHKNGLGWDILIRMELLTPLLQYTAQHEMEQDEVIRLGIDMCKSLESCQKLHIIHRDIKPENIFLSPTGDYKLGDFGIARTIEKTTNGLSKKGTYTYMAPEVYKGEQYGASVDIYSLGIVMYRLLNHNRGPFLPPYPVPIAHSDWEKAIIMRMKGIVFRTPVRGSGKLAEIVMKACAYQPGQRYASPGEMRTELEQLLKTSDPAEGKSQSVPVSAPSTAGLMHGSERVWQEEQTEVTFAEYASDGESKRQKKDDATKSKKEKKEKKNKDKRKKETKIKEKKKRIVAIAVFLAVLLIAGGGAACVVIRNNYYDNMYKEATCYYAGSEGYTVDYAKAYELYLKCAEQGNADAMYELGAMYYLHKIPDSDIDTDFEMAMEWVYEAIDAGKKDEADLLASIEDAMMYEEAVHYYEGSGGVETDYEKAYELFLKCAEHGNDDAMVSLYSLYIDNYIPDMRREEVIKWLDKAIEKGNVDAMYAMGYMYMIHDVPGTDEDTDYEKAYDWMLKAVGAGSRSAYNILGIIEDTIYHRQKAAIEWYKKGDDAGDCYAMYNLAYIYENDGRSVAAKRLYKRSAELGHEGAQSKCDELGINYEVQ